MRLECDRKQQQYFSLYLKLATCLFCDCTIYIYAFSHKFRGVHVDKIKLQKNLCFLLCQRHGQPDTQLLTLVTALQQMFFSALYDANSYSQCINPLLSVCLSLLNLSSKSLLITPASFPSHIFLWHLIIPHSLPLNVYAPYILSIYYLLGCCIYHYFSSVSPSLCFEG